MQIEDALKDIGVPNAWERYVAGSAAAVIVGGSGIVAYLDPAKSSIFPACPMFSLTGYACPGCGLTRGFHALFHGDIITAVDFNLLVPVWAIIFAYVVVSLLLVAIRGKGLPMWVTHPAFMWTFLAIMLLFGVLRNIPVYPLTILFP